MRERFGCGQEAGGSSLFTGSVLYKMTHCVSGGLVVNIYQRTTEDEVRKVDKSQMVKILCVMLRRLSLS